MMLLSDQRDDPLSAVTVARALSKTYGGKNVVSSAKTSANKIRTTTRMRTRVTRRPVRDRPRTSRRPEAPGRY